MINSCQNCSCSSCCPVFHPNPMGTEVFRPHCHQDVWPRFYAAVRRSRRLHDEAHARPWAEHLWVALDRARSEVRALARTLRERKRNKA